MTLSSMVFILIYFVLNGFYAGSETGSYMINRIRLRHRLLHRRHSARVLSWVLRDVHIFVFTVLIGQNIAMYLLTRTVTDLYIKSGINAHDGGRFLGFLPWNAEMASTLTLMFPLFILAEVGPKNLFRKKADVLMYRLAGLLRLSVLCFYPFTIPLKHLFHLLTRGLHEEEEREMHRLSPDGLKEYFSAGAKEGVISTYQNRMLDNVGTMHSVSVRDLMVPLKTIPRLPDDATAADFKRLAARRSSGFALLMHKHAVVGMVSIFTVVNRKLADGESLAPYADKVLKLQENRNLKSAFYRLRRNPRHSAVVLDAWKHPVGFIQLEDIARHIAGE